MRKKFFAMYALAGALVASPVFTSCVDDSESASVTALRGAKAEQLSALATLQKAQAEAAKVTADAEKAYKEAWAEYYKAQANSSNASADKILQEMEQAKAKFEYEIAYIKADYEKKIAKAKKAALKAEQEILENAEARLAALYINYSSAVNTLNDLKYQKAQKEMLLTEYEAGAVALDEVILQKKNDLEAQIAEAEAQIKAWETYQGIDDADLDAELLAAQQAKYAAWAAKEAADEAVIEPEEAAEEVLDQYDLDKLEEPSTVAAVAAIQAFSKVNPIDSYIYLGYFNDKDEAVEYYWEQVKNSNIEYVPGDVDKIYNQYGNNNDYGRYVIAGYMQLNGIYYQPFKTEYVEITDEKSVPLYSLTKNISTTQISQAFVAQKETYTKDLGAAATETTEATGYYKDLADAEKELKDYQKDLADAKEALTAGEAEVKAAQAKVDEAQAAVDAEQAKIDAEQDKIDAAEAVIATANSNKSYAQTEKSTYEGLKAQAEANKTTAEANKAAATTDEAKAAADADIAAATAAIADATAKIEAYTDKIEAAEEAIETADETIEAEQAKIAAANKVIADIQIALNEATRKLDQVQTMELTPAEAKVIAAKNDITQAESDIKNGEQSVARWKDNIEDAIEFLANADEILAAWEAVVAELSGDKFTAYEKEVKELVANETVAAWLTLVEAAAEANKAYTDAATLVTTLSSAIANDNVKNAAEEIATLKETIAELKLDIAELETTRMTISTEYPYTDNATAAYLDKAIEELKADIASLEEEIAIQEEVVAFRKAALDEFLANEEETPAE